MKGKIAIIIPTRERAHKISALHEAWFSFLDPTCKTDCIIVLDDDDEHTYPRLDGFIYKVVPTSGIRGATAPLNLAALDVCREYEYTGFFGDDHFPRTMKWNLTMYNVLDHNAPYAMAYANDLNQKENLPTSVVMDSRYIQKLGWMGHPTFPHIYIDDVWKFIGNYIGNLTYMGDIIIEHLHYSIGKSAYDNMYAVNNTTDMYSTGRPLLEKVMRDPSFLSQLNDIKAEMNSKKFINSNN